MKILLFFCTIIVCYSPIASITSFAQSKKQQGKLSKLCRKGKPGKIMSYISSQGLDVNSKINEKGSTCLMIASRRNKSPEAIKSLTEAGADVNAKDGVGYTPLIYATRNRSWYTNVIPALIQAGADVNAKDNVGKSVLMHAILKNTYKPPLSLKGKGLKERAKIANQPISEQSLIKAGADVNAKDNNGRTALMYAANYGEKSIIPLLIQSGADVNAKDTQDKTALMYVMMNMNQFYSRDLVYRSEKEGKGKKLINNFKEGATESGTRIDQINKKANDAREGIVKLLSGKGADVNSKDKWGQTPLMYISSSKLEKPTPEEIEAEVLKKEDKSVLYQGERIAKFLIENGADPNAKNNNGATALFYATGCTKVSDFEEVTTKPTKTEKKKSFISKVTEISEKNTAAAAANALPQVEYSNEHIVSLLIESGIDVNIKAKDKSNEEQTSVLSMFVKSGLNVEVVRMLIKAGSDREGVDSILKSRSKRASKITGPIYTPSPVTRANRDFRTDAKSIVKHTKSKK